MFWSKNKKDRYVSFALLHNFDSVMCNSAFVYVAGKGYRRLYESIGISSNVLSKDDFARVYLQLQELDLAGKSKLETSYQVVFQQV